MSINEMKKSCEIFARNGLGNEYFEAAHDVIFGPHYDIVKSHVSVEDIKSLKDMGWREGDYGTLDHHC